MASLNKEIKQLQPEKLVIVAGPSFGTAMKFVLFGAALGAGAVFYWTSQKGPMLPGSSDADAVLEGITGGGAKDAGKAQQLMTRLNSLSQRVKVLAGRAKEVAQTTAETAGPIISDAVAQGRSAAQEAQQQLQEDLKNEPAPPTPPPVEP